jgi:hypothetical protein
MTFRLIPHVVEASVAAGTGATVANRLRAHGGQALSAIPHPAAIAAGSALSGRLGSAPARMTAPTGHGSQQPGSSGGPAPEPSA